MSARLHPETRPFRTHRIAVGDGHTLFVEEVGRPDGIPVVVLHGGPGAGASAQTRRLFDPDRFRAILFDQRGALRSTPLGALEHNTTQDLAQDIVLLRRHLGIDCWIVFGGSWGVALALAYAELEPQAVAGFVLRGIYLGRRCEDRWQYQDGACALLPEAWADFIAPIPEDERGDLIGAYYRRLTGSQGGARLAAARTFLKWGLRTNAFHPNTEDEDLIAADFAKPFVEATARIAAHFAHHHSFLPTDDHLLKVAAGLPRVPAILVHGRYDLAVPLSSAFALKAAMPWARLQVIEAAGHAPVKPEVAGALLSALDAHASAWQGGRPRQG